MFKRLKNLFKKRIKKVFNKKTYNEGFEKGVQETAEKFAEIRMREWQVDKYNVLEIKNGKVFVGGEALVEADINRLQGEVKALEEFRIWNIMQETIRQKAVEKSVLHSENWEQVLAGKMMIHNLGIIKSILEVIKKV